MPVTISIVVALVLQRDVDQEQLAIMHIIHIITVTIAYLARVGDLSLPISS